MADQTSSREEKLLKIVLDGPTCTGKSVLVNRLKTGRFEVVEATIGAHYIVQLFNVDGMKFKTAIWDTCGHERAAELVLLYCRGADVIVEFFAIDSPKTLKEVLHFKIPRLKRAFPNTPILLVGVRDDLRQEN